MKRPEIWRKFIDTSHHIENVLQQFDEAYPWGQSGVYSDGEPGLPDRIAGQPEAGLRDLYCYFIDQTLARIEVKGRNWLALTTNNYNAKFSGTPAHHDWTTRVLKPNGYISEKAMKFPRTLGHRPPNKQSPKIWPQSNYKDLWVRRLGAAGPF